MDREILFRGKRKDNDEWIYGYYHRLFECIFLKDKPLIIAESDFSELFGALKYHTVKDNTVGQYTGLTDKNGKRIFEGDIIKKYGRTYKVVYDKYCFIAEGFYDSCYDDPWDAFSEDMEHIEVVGNIWDNSELIGGKQNEV